jgi:hypothetical protein
VVTTHHTSTPTQSYTVATRRVHQAPARVALVFGGGLPSVAWFAAGSASASGSGETPPAGGISALLVVLALIAPSLGRRLRPRNASGRAPGFHTLLERPG